MTDEPVVETPTVADMPPDLGNPAVADFADPAWDDTTDQEGEVPDAGEPDEDDSDVDDSPPDDDDEEPVVPPGIIEDQDQLPDPPEPDDYDPEE